MGRKRSSILTPSFIEKTAIEATTEILDHGLGNGTWREKFPRAYQDLLSYRADIQLSIEKILRNNSLV